MKIELTLQHLMLQKTTVMALHFLEKILRDIFNRISKCINQKSGAVVA